MEIYIGIEGITFEKSVGVLADQYGEIMSTVRLNERPLSLHTMPRRVLRGRISYLLTELLSKIGLKLDNLDRATLCIGLTGVTFRYDRCIDLPNEFKLMNLNIGNLICTGDAEIVFAGLTQQSHGSAIICHAGSTAYVITQINNQSYHVRFGGWGPAIGDEGSGYQMGRAALRAIGYEHDLRSQDESPLFQEISSWLNNPNSQVLSWQKASLYWHNIIKQFKDYTQKSKTLIDPRSLLFYFAHNLRTSDDLEHELDGIEFWRKIASGLIIPLFRAWENKDLIAKDIVETAIKDLSKQYKYACDIASLKSNKFNFNPIVFYGDVFNADYRFREELIKEIEIFSNIKLKPIISTDYNTMTPACGALLFALGKSKQENLRLPDNKLIRTVMKSRLQKKFYQDLTNE